MAITSLTGVGIFPTKPKTATYYGTSIASGTYVTLLSVTSGKGLVSRIIGGSAVGGATSWDGNYLFTIRITVDGTQYTVSSTTLLNDNANNIRGSEHSAGATGATVPKSSNVFDYQQPFYFTQSLTVELMQNAGTRNVYGFIDYATV